MHGLIILLLAFSLGGAAAHAQPAPPALRLLVFGADSRPIRTTHTAGVDDTLVPALATPAGRKITGGFIGRPIDDALLADIRDRLRDYYNGLSRPFVDIAIPSQDAAAGILRVNVVETTLGHVTVEGNRWFDTAQYLGAIHARPGGPIDIQTLSADTAWLNRIEQRHVAIAIEPTDDPTVYDLAIRAQDRLPLSVTLAADNTGTRETGLYRAGFGVDWTNAFWRGDDLNYGFLSGPDGFRLLQNALTYTTWLPWRDTMTVSAVIADTRGLASESAPAAPSRGRAEILSWRYAMMAPSSPSFSQQVDFGFDFKSTNTDLFSGGASVFPSTSELDEFSIAYAAREADTIGVTDATATLVASPGHFSPLNTAGALALQQPGASATYLYGRIVLDRLTDMAFGTAWNIRATGQYSSDNLLPSEQLAFGGLQSVRGYVELGATRDEGVLIQNEWRMAPLKTRLFPAMGDTEALVAFWFLDLGAGRDHLDIPGIRRSWLEMVSTGPGMTWHLTRDIALRLSWGVPLVNNGHTGPLLGPQFGAQITF